MDWKQIVGGVFIGAVLGIGGGILSMWRDTATISQKIEVIEAQLTEIKNNPISNKPGPQGLQGPKGNPGQKGEKGDSYSVDELARINAYVNKIRKNKYGAVIDVKGGAPWGNWAGPTYCPDNHYVCGINQRVEPHQKEEDDTAVNDLQIYCCSF